MSPKPHPSSNQLQWESWARLMKRVQEGDQEAYRQFLDEIGPVLFNFVRRRVFNPEMVRDVYQEVLLTLHKARHTYEPSRPLGPWLFTVARNSMLDALGRNRKFAEREVPTETFRNPPRWKRTEAWMTVFTRPFKPFPLEPGSGGIAEARGLVPGGGGGAVGYFGGRREGSGPPGV